MLDTSILGSNIMKEDLLELKRDAPKFITDAMLNKIVELEEAGLRIVDVVNRVIAELCKISESRKLCTGICQTDQTIIKPPFYINRH